MAGRFCARHALLPQGVARDVAIDWDAAGWITAVETGVPGADAADFAMPGVPNLHGHAFQRAMAGLAERQGPDAAGDDFWSWRQTMYGFLARLDPDAVQAIAAFLYAELLEGGFTAMAEFHYLHHSPDGSPHANPAELALRHIQAARVAGMGLTMLPSLYRHGGIFGLAPHDGQRRFLNDLSAFQRITEAVRAAVAGDANQAWGVAPHSLRAVTPDLLRDLLAWVPADTPVHIHAAEQMKEVQECLAATGARPVQWLLANMPVDARWCLIHATHLTASEVAALARSGAVAGLCPTTEANLGDGVFPARDFLAEGGRLGVGTDSHVGRSVAGELRQLEYSQRLALCRRALLADASEPSVGAFLVRRALAGGAQASGRRIGAFAVGMRADIVTLDGAHAALAGRDGAALLDSFVFSGDGGAIDRVLVGGREVVRGGRHVARAALLADYRRAVAAWAGAGAGAGARAG
jgi:formimidoylglutamate deiminase